MDFHDIYDIDNVYGIPPMLCHYGYDDYYGEYYDGSYDSFAHSSSFSDVSGLSLDSEDEFGKESLEVEEKDYWQKKSLNVLRFTDDPNVPGKALRLARKKMAERRPKSIGDLALSQLNEDRTSEANHCDVTIKAGTRMFPAHKNVLSAVSDYFLRMFNSEMMEKYEKVIELKEISSECFEKILDFVYFNDSDPIITNDDVYDFLPIARYLQISFLIRSCGHHFVANLTAENVFTNWAFAKVHSFKLKQTEKYIDKHIKNILQNSEFVQLERGELEEIVKIVSSPEYKYNCVMKWIESVKNERKKHIDELFELINFRNLPTDFLFNTVCQEPLVMTSQPLFELTAKAMSNRDLALRCINHDSHTASVVFLNITPERHLQVRQYNLETKVWTDLPSLKTIGEGFGTAFSRSKIFVIGGRAETGLKSRGSVYTFDLSSDPLQDWVEATPLCLPRRNMGCAVLGGELFVLGGFATRNCLTHLEVMQVMYSSFWSTHSKSIKSKRQNLALVTCGDMLYAIGGSSTDRGQPCNFNERYSISKGWKERASMLEPRGDKFAAISLNGKIYVMGSNKVLLGSHVGASAECFDPVSNKWTKIANLKSLQFVNSACVVNGKLHAFGYSIQKKVPLLEVYDPFKNVWEIVEEFALELREAKAIAV